MSRRSSDKRTQKSSRSLRKRSRRLKLETLEQRRVLAALNPLELSSLLPAGGGDGAAGFVFEGEHTQSQLGQSVASAGDVNGDGFEDLIVGSLRSSSHTGEAYLLFGKGDGFSATSDPTALDGSTGYRFIGTQNGDFAGFSVGGAGDVNGDGFADVIIGAYGVSHIVDSQSYNLGEAYVLFGGSHLATLDNDDGSADGQIDLGNLDGTNGFALVGNVVDSEIVGQLGYSVDSAGDVNGDGYSDVVVGAPSTIIQQPSQRLSAGSAYVMFGKPSGFSAAVDVTSFDGSDGFKIHGQATFGLGSAVATARDVTDDGFADILIGAPNAHLSGFDAKGEAYLIFGINGGFAATIDTANLATSDGITITGEVHGDRLGSSLASARDFNGDGGNDFIIGAPGASSGDGSAYLVYNNMSLSDFTPSDLDGTNGFTFTEAESGEALGSSVGAIGDLNGDGFDDVVLGAPLGSPNAEASAGQSYVAFGGFHSLPEFDLSLLDGFNGFQLNGIGAGDISGTSVSGAGDLNGDGYDELVIGAPAAFVEDTPPERRGQAYVFFGSDLLDAVTHEGDASANTLNSANPTEVFVAGRGNDIANDTHGFGVLRGGQGDDVFTAPDFDFGSTPDGLPDIGYIVGGAGFDTVSLLGAGQTLDLSTIPDGYLQGIEAIDISGSGSNTLTVSALEVVNLSNTSNTLTVFRDSESDIVNRDSGWKDEGLETIDGTQFRIFTNGAARLEIEDFTEPITHLNFDFNAFAADGMTSTLPGFVGASIADQIGSGQAFGWEVTGAGRLTDMITGIADEGLTDGIYIDPTDTARFSAELANGDYNVTLTLQATDLLDGLVSEEGFTPPDQQLNGNAPIGSFVTEISRHTHPGLCPFDLCHVVGVSTWRPIAIEDQTMFASVYDGFVQLNTQVSVRDGQLDIEFHEPLSDQFVALLVSTLIVQPTSEIADIDMSLDDPDPIANGRTPITINGSNATANSEVTIIVSRGEIVTEDINSSLAGIQVATNANGEFSFEFVTDAFGVTDVSALEIQGRSSGEESFDIRAPRDLHFDIQFDQIRDNGLLRPSVTADGYLSFTATSTLAHNGYELRAANGDVWPFAARVGHPLYEDALDVQNAQIDLRIPSGTYLVNLTFQSAGTVSITEGDNVHQVSATTGPFHYDFPVTVGDDGLLNLELRSNERIYLYAMDVVESPVDIPLTVTTEAIADGATIVRIEGAASSIVTVQSDIGVQLLTDHVPQLDGAQVGPGSFSFEAVTPVYGTHTFDVVAIDGTAKGSIDVDFDGPGTWHYDIEYFAIREPDGIIFDGTLRASRTAAGYHSFTDTSRFATHGYQLRADSIQPAARSSANVLYEDALAMRNPKLEFRIPNGNYLVNLAVESAGSFTIDQSGNSHELDGAHRGPFFYDFPVEITDERLNLQFLGSSPITLFALDIVEAPAQITLDLLNDAIADGGTALHVTGAAEPGKLLTIKTDESTRVLTNDDAAFFHGTQIVRSNEAGLFSFDVVTSVPGEHVLEVVAFDGSEKGTLEVDFAAPDAWHYDIEFDVFREPDGILFDGTSRASWTAAGYYSFTESSRFATHGYQLRADTVQPATRNSAQVLYEDALAMRNPQLEVRIPNGNYLINLAMESASAITIDQEGTIHRVNDNEFNINYANAGPFHFDFPAEVTDGRLNLKLTSRHPIILFALDVVPEPAEIRLTQETPAIADSNTVMRLRGEGATPGANVTIRGEGLAGEHPTLQIVTPDAAAFFADTQVVADERGEFTVEVTRRFASDDVTFTAVQLDGEAKGTIDVDFESATELHLDFGGQALQEGYGANYAPFLFEDERLNISRFAIQPALSVVQPHRGRQLAAANESPYFDLLDRLNVRFMNFSLPISSHGDYLVNVVTGASNGDLIVNDVLGASLVHPFGNGYLSAGQVTTIDGPGGLDVEITNAVLGGGASTDLAAIDVWRLDDVNTITLQVPEAFIADGVTPVTLTGGGAPAGALLNVESIAIQVASEDADPYLWAGHQVRADENGEFSFDAILSNNATLEIREVTGRAYGRFPIQAVFPNARRFDFDVPSRAHHDPRFTSVQGHEAPAVHGFGWTELEDDEPYENDDVTYNVLSDGLQLSRGTFRTGVSSGAKRINLTFTNTTGRDGLLYVTYPDPDDNGTTRETETIRLPTQAGAVTHHSFDSFASEDVIDVRLRYESGSGRREFAINALEIIDVGDDGRLSITPLNQSPVADGVDPLFVSGSGATPESWVTISTDLGTIITPDENSDYHGTQIYTNENGQFSFRVLASLAGAAKISAEETTGVSMGSANVEFVAPSDRHFDFGDDFLPFVRTGYADVPRSNSSFDELGFGWQLLEGERISSYLDTSVSDRLLADGHRVVDETFEIDLPADDYVVNFALLNPADSFPIVVRVEDISDPEQPHEFINTVIEPFDELSTQVRGIATKENSSSLKLRIHSNDVVIVQALEVLPEDEVSTITFDAGTATIGDGITPAVIQGNNATPDSFVTVTATGATITTPDAHPLRRGKQVRVSETGGFEFEVLAARHGTVEVHALDVDGSAVGTGLFGFDPSPERHFDFDDLDENSPDNPRLRTAQGYISATRHGLHSQQVGYGWLDRTTQDVVIPVDDDLLSDAVVVGGSERDIFLVDTPDGDFVVNLVLHGTGEAATQPFEIGTSEFEANVPAQGFANEAFEITSNGQLVFDFPGGNRQPTWRIAAIDLFPGAIDEITITGPFAFLEANGQVDTYVATGADPGSIVTITSKLGTIVTEDVDALFAGVQVVADENGSFEFEVRRTDVGKSTITAKDTLGRSYGELDVLYIAPRLADLQIVHAVSPTRVDNGDPVGHTVFVTNDGPNTATNVQVELRLPNDLLDPTFATSEGTSFDRDTSIWTIPELPPTAGENRVGLGIVSTAESDAMSLLSVAEIIASDQTDPDSTPNNNRPTEDDYDTARISLVHETSLSLEVKTNADRVLPGEDITFRVQLTNRGPDSATNVAVTSLLPSNLGNISVIPPARTTFDTETGIWRIPFLASTPGENTLQLVVSGISQDAGVVELQSQITASDQLDPNSLLNVQPRPLNALVLVQGTADLSLTQTTNNLNPQAGDSVQFEVTVSNAGPDVARDVVVRDIVPIELQDVVITAPQDTMYDTETSLWQIPLLSPIAGENKLKLVIEGVLAESGPISNTAEVIDVVDLDPDSTPNNNRGIEDDQTTITLPDLDLDGVGSHVESAAPNDGDGNRDGERDARQAHVASLPNNANGEYITLVASDTVSLVDVSTIQNPSPTDTPVNAEFPIGFVDFIITDLEAGAATTVDVLLPQGVTVNEYYKYGPTPKNPTPHWYNFEFDGTTGAEFTGEKIILHFIDGGRGDNDLIANGQIVDPGGPGLSLDVGWQNAINAFDVNGDQEVSPVDVLVVVNELSERTVSNPTGLLPTRFTREPDYIDVNGDGFVTPLDALAVINELNLAGGEGESFTPPVTNSTAAQKPYDSLECATLPKVVLNSIDEFVGPIPLHKASSRNYETTPPKSHDDALMEYLDDAL